MFNSSLVFYRDTFLKQFQEGRVPSHVLLAMYASATMYATVKILGLVKTNHKQLSPGDV